MKLTLLFMLFPESDVGTAFYADKSGPVKCPGLCEKALTEADKGTINWFQRNFQKAKIVCDRIRDVPENYEASRKAEKLLQKRVDGQLLWAQNNFGKDKEGLRLQTLAREAFRTAENGYNPNASLPGVKRNFKEKKENLIKELTSACASPGSMTLQSFCKFYTPEKNPVVTEMERISGELDDIKLSDFNLYTKPRYVPKLDPKGSH